MILAKEENMSEPPSEYKTTAKERSITFYADADVLENLKKSDNKTRVINEALRQYYSAKAEEIALEEQVSNLTGKVASLETQLAEVIRIAKKHWGSTLKV